MPVITYGIEAWDTKKERNEENRENAEKGFKKIFKLPVSTSYTGLKQK